jgi:hypothetical protein
MSSVVTGSGKAPYFTTGSGPDVVIPIIFVDGKQANADYGVAIYGAVQCPQCHFPQGVTLSFNPGDSHYYYYCMNCQKWSRYLNPDGSLSDFQVVTTAKSTPVDSNLFLYKDMDYNDSWNWTW